MNIILLGPPGSGKGTQSKFIVNKYKLQLISFGDILRNYNFNKLNIRKINNGTLINNKLANYIVKKYINNNFNSNGFLFDGFPRNVIQAKFLKFIKINCIIELCVSDNIILDRLLNRKVHIKSGRIYNIKYNPPIMEGIDDITGEKLVSRLDDLNSNIIKKRLIFYKRILINLKNYYKIYFGNKFVKYYISINANKNINLVKNTIINIIENIFF